MFRGVCVAYCYVQVCFFVSMAYTPVCGTRACVALACAHVCVQDMTHAHLKMKCKQKHGTFHAYYPGGLLPSYVAPMYSNVTNIHVLVCDLYVAVCVFMDPYVTRMYSRLSLRHVCVRKEEIKITKRVK